MLSDKAVRAKELYAVAFYGAEITFDPAILSKLYKSDEKKARDIAHTAPSRASVPEDALPEYVTRAIMFARVVSLLDVRQKVAAPVIQFLVRLANCAQY